MRKRFLPLNPPFLGPAHNYSPSRCVSAAIRVRWKPFVRGRCGLNELATPELYTMTQPPGKLVIRYRKHSMDTCGARRAPLSARPQPRRQWLAPLKVLSLLFLTAPISAWASDLQPQNIEPRARPFNGSRTSGGKLCSY